MGKEQEGQGFETPLWEDSTLVYVLIHPTGGSPPSHSQRPQSKPLRASWGLLAAQLSWTTAPGKEQALGARLPTHAN